MINILHKIGHAIVIAGVAIGSLFGFHQAPQQNVGAAIPVVVATFQSSLQSGITASATSMTLVSGVDKAGNNLSGYICFNIDEGSALEEFVCGTASGTSVTSMIRGIDPVDGDLEVTALKKIHARGASVKITNYPSLAVLSRILNGTETLPNILTYATAPTFTTGNQIITKTYADSIAVAGAPDASTSTKGITKLSTAPASPTIPIAVGDNDTRVPTQAENDAQAGNSGGAVSSSNKLIDNNDSADDGYDQTQTTQNATIASGEANATTKKNKTAQSFTAGFTSITGVVLYKSANTGTNAGDITVSLQADSAGAPSGSSLASVTVAAATYNALATGLNNFVFSSAYSSMTIGSTYWIVISSTTSDNSNCINLGTASAGGYSGGSVKYNNTTDGWVAVSTIDLTFKTIQGVANKVVRYDSNGGTPFVYVSDTASSDTYTVIDPSVTAYYDGLRRYVKITTANTGASTINFNGLGAKTLKKNYNSDTDTGDILAGQIIQIVYDSANSVFQIVSPSGTPISYTSGTTTKDSADASTTQTIAHGLGKTPKKVKIRCIGLTSATTGVNISAEAVYNGTTQSSTSIYYINSGNTFIQDNTFSLNMSGGSNNWTRGVITFDATNINIAWTKTGNPAGTYYILWEAE